jgi:hypothetical protein
MFKHNGMTPEYNRTLAKLPCDECGAVYAKHCGTMCPDPEVGTPDPKPVAVAEPAGGMKFDGGKPRWSLLMQGCSKALAGVAEVLTFGAKKYAAHSWKGVENNKERYRDAMYRHLNAIESGEVLDPESGLPHWDHVACNALFLSELNKETK